MFSLNLITVLFEIKIRDLSYIKNHCYFLRQTFNIERSLANIMTTVLMITIR